MPTPPYNGRSVLREASATPNPQDIKGLNHQKVVRNKLIRLKGRGWSWGIPPLQCLLSFPPPSSQWAQLCWVNALGSCPAPCPFCLFLSVPCSFPVPVRSCLSLSVPSRSLSIPVCSFVSLSVSCPFPVHYLPIPVCSGPVRSSFQMFINISRYVQMLHMFPNVST